MSSSSMRLLASALLAVGLLRPAAAGLSPLEAFARDAFGPSAAARPLPLAATNAAVSEVVVDGQTAGWVFRTDQVPPACKGKRGEIVLAVAIGTDARIRDLRVVSHREDARYFARLGEAFFRQFREKRADAGTEAVDAVTRATYSSRAIIREVMEGARVVASQPEVAAKVRPAQDCPLTKTAALSHN